MKIEIVVTALEHGPFLSRCLASIGKHVAGSYALRVLSDPETSQYEKYAEAFAGRQAPILILTEDDVEIINDDLVPSLLNGLDGFDSVALVGCAEYKSFFDRGFNGEAAKTPYRYKPIGWIPGYMMVFDFRKLKPEDILPDLDIPGKAGSADVDLSLQVRKAGFNVLLAQCPVYHSRGQTPSTAEDWNKNFPERHAYMQAKWGAGYLKQEVDSLQG